MTHLIILTVVLSVVSLLMSKKHRLSYGFESFARPYEKGKTKPKGTKPSKFFNPMALIKTAGTGVVGISGKIAGTVYSAGGSAGPFARVWAKPRNARTSLQQFVRGVFAGLSSSFRALTPDQVAAWNAAATSDNPNSIRRNVFGDQKVMSGAQMYEKINNLLLQIGASVISDPPVAAPVDSIVSMDASAAASPAAFTLDIDLFSGGAAVPANNTLVVFATNQKSNGRSFFGKSQYRLIGVYPAGTTIPVNILTDYVSKFGSLVAGQKVGVYAHMIYNDTGLFGKSGSVYATATVS